MNQVHKRFVESKTQFDAKWFVVLFLLVAVIGISGCASTPPTPPPPVNSPVPPTLASVAEASPTAAAVGAATNTTAAAEPTTAPSGAPTTSAAPATATTAAALPPTAAPTPDTQHPLSRPDMTIRKVATVGASNVKIARNPMDGEVYYLHSNDGIFHVDLKTGDTKRVVALTEIVTNGVAAGMTFEQDGTLLVVVDQNATPKMNHVLIRRGTPNEGGTWMWDTLAETEPYPLAGNNFDHLYNGIVVSPDGKSVFVNAGSRSDHGEVEDNQGAFPNLREVPLTSGIFRIPADSQDLILPADETALKPYLYADGTRNSFDPEFAPNGDLIAGDNGPDADFPDELNWIQQGHHYGFPWKFGIQDNPQRSPDYSGLGDPYLQSGFFAVDNGFYHNDKTFPPPPDGVTFTDPIVNFGPDAAHYRAPDGSEHDAAAEGKTLNTFTPHRSPLGLAFVTGNKMPADLRSTDTTISAFITGWGAAAGTLSDRGADLLHLELTKKGDHYEMTTHQVAKGFNYPVSGLLIGNHYYLLEWGQNGAIWEITFGNATSQAPAAPTALTLTSSSFADGQTIPDKYTFINGTQCQGQNISPALAWSGAPAGTASFAVTLIDPDGNDWVHWVQFNIPPDVTSLPEAVKGPDVGIKGRSSFGTSEYGGPCPPGGNHHYTFTVYALDTMLNTDSSSAWSDVQQSMKNHILAQAQLVGMRGK